MHVLFYINSLATGGAERTLVKLANTLAETHRVTVVTQQPRTSDRFNVSAEVERISTHTGATSTSIFSALKNNWLRIWRLRAIIKARQPDVVVAFMATANTVATLAVQGTGVPVVVSERNHPPALPLSPLHRAAQKLANRLADHMVVLTRQTEQWYRTEQRLTALSVIPNGVSYPIPATEPRVPPDAIVPAEAQLVLCVGRIDPQKQPTYALEAFAEVAQDFPAWQLVWLGRGNTEELTETANKLGLAGRFSAPGAVGNVQDWYERADIYLMTSAFEGFPNSLLEAMACGCASIALDCPTGPQDIVQPGHNGELLPLTDREQLLASLRSLMNNPDRRNTLGAHARTVREQFSDAATHSAWLALLQQVAARR